MKDDFTDVLTDIASIAILEAMPEDALPGLEVVLNTKDEKKIETYIRTYLPHVEDTLKRKGELLRAEMVH